MKDILFKQEDFVFSYRVGGVLMREGKILLQRQGSDYAFIGGHVSIMETTAETLAREFREELHADVRVGDLMAVGEIFFPWGNRPCHQIAFYYNVELTEPSQIPADGVFHGYDELDNERIDLDFCWVPLEELETIAVYPAELIPHIRSGAKGIFHFVSRQI